MLDATHEGMTLTWTPPEDNGGSTIAGYIIERKEARSDRWMKVSKNPVTMTRYRSSGLIEGLEYEHRVTAINSRGTGKPSESSDITVAMDPIGTCSSWSLREAQFLRVSTPNGVSIFIPVFFQQSLQVLHLSPASPTPPGPRSLWPGCPPKKRVVLSLLGTTSRCRRWTRWNGHCATPRPPRCASTR